MDITRSRMISRKKATHCAGRKLCLYTVLGCLGSFGVAGRHTQIGVMQAPLCSVLRGGAPQCPAPVEGKDWNEGRPLKTVGVTFEVRCENTAEDVNVVLIGGEAELGEWQVLDAVDMSTSKKRWPVWSTTVTLPAGGMIDYKYAMSVKGLRPYNATHLYNATEWEQHVAQRSFTVQKLRSVFEKMVALVRSCNSSTGSGNSSSGDPSTVVTKADVAVEVAAGQFVREGRIFQWEGAGNHLSKVGRRYACLLIYSIRC